MRAAVNILGVLVTIGGMCWIVFGEGVLTLPLRVGVVLGALFCIGITAYLVHAHRRRQRLERNLAYYANGYTPSFPANPLDEDTGGPVGGAGDRPARALGVTAS